jgi:DHA2 family multidrug resistance protein
LLAGAGLIGATVWLWVAKRPVVNIHVFKDRNFATGCVMIFCMAMVLYASAVIIPQLAQTVLGYTAFWAGLVLSPGSLLICFMIPLVGRALPRVQTRYLIAFGFLLLGFSLLYSHGLTPDIDFKTLAMMRAAQTIGLAFLFVPISTITYSTLPKEVNGDAAALFTMFRNLAGSIGISAASALITERTQVHLASLQPHLTPLNPAFNAYIQHVQGALHSLGVMPAEIPQRALNMAYQTWQAQSSLLAYTDVFAVTAVLSFAVIPLTLLFSPTRSGGRMPAH